MHCRQCDHAVLGWQKVCPECGAPVPIRYGGGSAATVERSDERPSLGTPRTRRVAMQVRSGGPLRRPESVARRVAMLPHGDDSPAREWTRKLRRLARSGPLRIGLFILTMALLLLAIDFLRHMPSTRR